MRMAFVYVNLAHKVSTVSIISYGICKALIQMSRAKLIVLIVILELELFSFKTMRLHYNIISILIYTAFKNFFTIERSMDFQAQHLVSIVQQELLPPIWVPVLRVLLVLLLLRDK
jgi:hypothetical protein